MRELCFINAVMNSHTTVWSNTNTWNRRYYLLIPCIVGIFQHDNEDINPPRVKILQCTCISLSLISLKQLWGILWRRAEQCSPLKTFTEFILQELNGTDVKMCHEHEHSVTRRVRAVYIKFWRTYEVQEYYIFAELNLGCTHFCNPSFKQNWIIYLSYRKYWHIFCRFY